MMGSMGYGIRQQLNALAMALTSLGTGFVCVYTPIDTRLMRTEFSSRQTRVPGEYLVTLAPGSDVKVITDLYGRFRIKDVRDLGRNIFLVTITEDPGPAKMEELSGQNSHVKAIQANFVYRTNGRWNTQ